MRGLDLFGPIFTWEVVRQARRWRTFQLRIGYAALLLVVFFLACRQARVSNVVGLAEEAAATYRFFVSMSFVQLLAVLFVTPSYVTLPLVQEKERRTFDYLCDTHLTNREIVLGKWAAGSLTIAHLLVAGLPVLALSSFLGGIDLLRLLTMTLITLATLLSVSALCLFVAVSTSAVNLCLRQAWTAVILLLLIGPCLPWLLVGATAQIAMPPRHVYPFAWSCFKEALDVTELVTYVEPFVAYGFLLGPRQPLSSLLRLTLAYVAVHGSFALVLLSLSCARVRTAYRKQTPERTGSDRDQRRRPGRERKTLHVGENAMLWKEWHFTDANSNPLSLGISSRWLTITLYLVPFVLLVVGVAVYPHWGQVDVAVYADRFIAMLIPLCTIAVLAISILRATSLAGERQRESWALVLATPLTAEEILRAKLLGAMKPVFYFLALVTPTCFVQFLATDRGGVLFLVWPVLVLFYGWLGATAGLYTSLFCKTARSAFVAASIVCFILIVFVPQPFVLMSWYRRALVGGMIFAVLLASVHAFVGVSFYIQCVATFDRRFGRMPSNPRHARR